MPLEAARELGKKLCEAIIKHDEQKAQQHAAELEAARQAAIPADELETLEDALGDTE